MSDYENPSSLFWIGILLVAGVAFAAWKLGWFQTITRAVRNVEPVHQQHSQQADD